MGRAVNGKPPSIEQLAVATQDERARQRFVSTLRKRVMVDMAGSLRQVWERDAAPRARRKLGRAPVSGVEVRRAMLDHPYFQAWSALRYSAQEMTWWSVQPQVERHLPELIVAAQRAAHDPGVGTLRLNPQLPVPRDVSAMDIHLMPGCFHSEYQPDDVAVAAVYHHGTAVFSAGLKLRPKGGGVARSIAEFIRVRYPKLKPARLLDIGCTTGTNLFPYLDAFTECAGYGVDVAAPMLRFAHAVARSRGYNAHFSQQNACELDFPVGYFDVVVSSFFLHEQSPATNRRILNEVYRVLRPGGLMVHMELPPSSEVDPYYDFYLDWDAYYNNEPHYASFRALNMADEVARAGFARKAFFKTRIANYGTVPQQEFVECVLGKRPAPAHGNGASWFIFGAVK